MSPKPVTILFSLKSGIDRMQNTAKTITKW